MLALLKNDTILSVVDPGAWFSLPNGDQISPAFHGWHAGEFRLAEVQPADEVPSGKRVVATSIELVAGQPKHVNTLEDVAPVDPLTIPLPRLEFWLAAAEVSVSKWGIRDRIADMPEGREKHEAIAWFEEAKQYRRNDPILNAMADLEGIPPEQLDALWIWAVQTWELMPG